MKKNLLFTLGLTICAVFGLSAQSTIQTRTISSSSTGLGVSVTYNVYLPPSYSTSPTRTYPVLYLLHGGGGSYVDWVTQGNMKSITDAEISAGRVQEMIIVMPDAVGGTYGWYDGQYSTFMTNVLYPNVQSAYRASTVQGGRSIAGLSMGGFGTTYQWLANRSLYSSAYAMSAAITLGGTNLTTLLNTISVSQLSPYSMEIGTEDFLYQDNVTWRNTLNSKGVNFTYLERSGAHTWPFWQACLPKALKLASDNFTTTPPQNYTLTTSVVGNGSITLSPSGGTYASGTVVTVTAVPATGYTFTGWSGSLTGTANPSTITMNANKSVTATFTASSTGTNLALNKTVVVSSTQSSSYPGSYAVDGNTSTRWSSTSTNNQWIYVDLGTAQTISRVVLKWEAAYASAYYIQTSANASTWTTVSSVTGGNGATDDISFTAVSARYVRMYCVTRATSYGVSLYEFEIYGSGGTNYTLTTSVSGSGSITLSPSGGTYASGTVVTVTAVPATGYTFTGWSGSLTGTTNPATVTMNANKSVTATFTASSTGTNLALNRPVTVSSTESTSYPGSNAVDGNTGTRWSSAFSVPQSIYVDLGSTKTVAQVYLLWEAAYANGYQVQVSTNASTWTTVSTVTGGNGGSDVINFTATTARYVRIYCTSKATSYGVSLYEFEVYGSQTKAAVAASVDDAPASESEILVFPNPADDFVIVKAAPEGKVSLCTITGSVIESKTLVDSEVSFNTASLAKGVYLIIVDQQKGRTVKNIVVK